MKFRTIFKGISDKYSLLSKYKKDNFQNVTYFDDSIKTVKIIYCDFLTAAKNLGR